MEVWKSFEQNTVTHSAAHHIMTIANLIDAHGYARVTDVAKSLGISRSSASITLKALKTKGYVDEDENKFLRLSQEGEKLSDSIKFRRLLLGKFFSDILQVSKEQAEIDACKMEHLLSIETGEKLLGFMSFFLSDDPKVKASLNDYWKKKEACNHDEEECPVCQGDCLMPDNSND